MREKARMIMKMKNGQNNVDWVNSDDDDDLPTTVGVKGQPLAVSSYLLTPDTSCYDIDTR